MRKANPKNQVGFIYFAHAVGTSFVKIGWTTLIEGRMAQIQVGCPHRVVPLGGVPARWGDEPKFFSVFAAHRVRGEWFERTGRLDEFLTLLPSLPMLAGHFFALQTKFFAFDPATVFNRLGIADPPRRFRTPKQIDAPPRWVVQLNREVARLNRISKRT